MMRRAILGSLYFSLIASGCDVTPRPGAAAVVIAVSAKPKAGLHDRFARVPVYDAAPVAAPSGQYEHVDYAALDDIIVWLEPAPASSLLSPIVSITVDVDHPSTVIHAVATGGKLNFVLHSKMPEPVSLYSVSDGNDFKLPPRRSGESVACEVRAQGLIEVLADPSSPPVALIYAAPSPWVARARSGEKVVFDNVPPGTYQAVSWHPRLPGSSTNLMLAKGSVTHCDLGVGVGNLPAVQE